MPTSRVDVATAYASRYLQQLCKHWAHKFPVEFDPNHGTIDLSHGPHRSSTPMQPPCTSR